MQNMALIYFHSFCILYARVSFISLAWRELILQSILSDHYQQVNNHWVKKLLEFKESSILSFNHLDDGNYSDIAFLLVIGRTVYTAKINSVFEMKERVSREKRKHPKPPRHREDMHITFEWRKRAIVSSSNSHKIPIKRKYQLSIRKNCMWWDNKILYRKFERSNIAIYEIGYHYSINFNFLVRYMSNSLIRLVEILHGIKKGSKAWWKFDGVQYLIQFW